MSDLIRSDILTKISHEREYQAVQWGDLRHIPEQWVTLLAEELGEVAKAIIESDSNGYAAELVQLAAVAVAALEQAEGI